MLELFNQNFLLGLLETYYHY